MFTNCVFLRIIIKMVFDAYFISTIVIVLMFLDPSNG